MYLKSWVSYILAHPTTVYRNYSALLPTCQEGELFTSEGSAAYLGRYYFPISHHLL